MRTSVVGFFVLVACSRGPAAEVENPADSIAAPDTVDLAVPEHPAARAGRLVTAAVSTREDIDASGAWRAEATLCQAPTVVQLIAHEALFSAIVLFLPPEDGDAAGDYDILEGNSNLPDSSTARVGLQVHPVGERPAAFVAFDGTVEIERLDAALVGRLSVVAAEARYFDTLFLAGSFDVPIRNASDASCRVMGEPLD
jgi:hypothetical protein